MTSRNPVLTPDALASAAGKKTVKVQRKLRAAEGELRTANTVLRKAVPKNARRDIDEALAENTAAEQKVREATDELEVVSELLGAAAGDSHAGAADEGAGDEPKGRSGQGARSLLPHLSRK
ncbi:MAG: hypothetical protein ACXWJM_08325 [Ramlibacter sp.]